MRVSDGASRWVRLAAFAAALIVGVACVIARPDRSGPEPGSDRPAPNIGEFEDDVNGAVAVAEQYWRERFAAMGLRFQPVRRIIAYQAAGEVSCGGQPFGRNNAAYCAAGDFVAYDVNWAVASACATTSPSPWSCRPTAWPARTSATPSG